MRYHSREDSSASATTRYVPFGTSTAGYHAPFSVLGHKMTNGTKGSQFSMLDVLQPLLVRTIEDDKYEVIAGARRLRAAKLAALEEVPVRVVETLGRCLRRNAVG